MGKVHWGKPHINHADRETTEDAGNWKHHREVSPAVQNSMFQINCDRLLGDDTKPELHLSPSSCRPSNQLSQSANLICWKLPVVDTPIISTAVRSSYIPTEREKQWPSGTSQLGTGGSSTTELAPLSSRSSWTDTDSAPFSLLIPQLATNTIFFRHSTLTSVSFS